MFIVLTIIYSLIIFISLFGDYEGKEIEEWKKKWEKLFEEKYY